MDKTKANITHRNDKEGTPSGRGMIAPFGKTVPVVVLMAMNPALLNTAATKNNLQGEEEHLNMITMVSPSKTVEPEEATYVMSPKVEETQQAPKKAPYGWELFLQDTIVGVHKGHNGLGDFDMVYTNEKDDIESVSDVYIVEKEGWRGEPAKPVIAAFHPPRVYKLIHHDLGRDKEFCGVVTHEHIIDKNGNYVGKYEKEIPLDDETAQKLIDLVLGHSKWKNNTFIKIYKTKSEHLQPFRKY